MHERIRDYLLSAWGRSVAAHPALTLALCVLLAAGSIILTATGLEFHADRNKLIDPDRPWNREYARYRESFPRYRDVTVVLEGAPGDPAVDRLARRISRRLAEDERIESADAGFDLADTGPRFFRVAGREQFDETLEELADARRLAAASNANAALGLLLADVRRREGEEAALGRLERFLEPYLAAARDGEPDFGFLLPDRSRWQPLASAEGEGPLRFVRVQLADTGEGVNRLSATLRWMRETVGRTVSGSDADVTWGVTGIPAMEADETSQAIHDSTLASVLAIALITVVMLVAFRGFAVPLLAATALLIGMSWSFGWLMVSVGHLQILSVVFSVILLGLGIDFALLYTSRLELVQDEYDDLAAATARVYRRMGPGMVTGAVTTSAAFAATALTDFKGMAEMGLIAAGGILLCLIAVLSAFPALLALTRRWKRIIRHRPGGETAHFARGRLDFVDAHPLPTLLAAGVVVAALVGTAFRVEYDANVLNLQSAGVESVQWERRVVEEDARSAWSAVVLAGPDRAAWLADRLRKVPEVSGVGGMGMLFPPDREQRRRLIAELRERPVTPLEAQPGLATTLGQLAAVQAGLRRRLDGVPPGPRQRLDALAGRIGEAVSAGAALPPEAQRRAWTALDNAFVAARDRLAAWLEAALAEEPVSADALPPLLRELWIGRDGSWLLLAYPQADPQQRSVLDPQRLGPFVNGVSEALAGTGVNVIGPPVQIYRSSELIKSEYVKAACYAIAAILVLLFLDFRKLTDALCAMAPVTVGFVGAFGLMGLLGVPLNFANIIIMPIIFGIGVNAGVHVVHRWRLEPNGRPRGLSGGTGRGITLTMITTMIGFGCLLIAEHRGIRSLGFVMIIGLGVTLLACYTILPAILRLRREAAVEAAAGERGHSLRAIGEARLRRSA